MAKHAAAFAPGRHRRRVTAADWLRAVLPPAGPARRVAAITLIDAMGTGFFLSGSVVFFTRFVGLTPHRVGIGMSVAGAVALLGSIPGGKLADRFGARPILVLLNLAQAVSFTAYLWVDDFATFLPVVCVTALIQVAGSPVRSALVGVLFGASGRVRVKAYLRSTTNAGFAVGAALAGVVLAVDTRAAYLSLVLGNVASFVAAAALALTLPRTPPVASGRTGRTRPATALRDGRFVALTVVDGLIGMYHALFLVGVPLWVLTRTSAPRPIIAWLLVLNTILVVLLQVRLSRGADALAGAGRTQLRSGFVLAAACGLFALSQGREPAVASMLLVGAAAVMTIGELLQSAASWGISYGLAPPDRQGEYLGVFGLGRGLQDGAGPFLAATVLLGLEWVGWLAFGLWFAVLGMVTVPLVAQSAARPVPEPPVARRALEAGDPVH